MGGYNGKMGENAGYTCKVREQHLYILLVITGYKWGYNGHTGKTPSIIGKYHVALIYMLSCYGPCNGYIYIYK